MRVLALAFALAPAALLGSCGGGGEDAGETKAVAGGDAAEIASAYERSILLAREGNGQAACALFTPEYEEQLIAEAREAGLDVTCPQAVTALAAPIRDFKPHLEQIEVSGGSATAVDPGYGRFEAQDFIFEKVDGEWLIAQAK